MAFSFEEYYHQKTGLTVGVERKLFSKRSEYQQVEVYETDTWGNMMVIDGMVMLSERDEFVYHEMLSHVPLFSHPEPARVLIIGGGDGGTAREVLRHQNVKTVDLVEIDEMVVQAAKEFLPDVGDWQNPDLNVIFGDGVAFVNNVTNLYDVILIDGSDPVGPAQGLFGKDFLQACYRALSDNGVLAAQTESPWVESYHPSMKQVFDALGGLYSHSKMYLAYIPLYPAGMWSFAFASKGVDPLREATQKQIREGLAEFDCSLRYYNADIHNACFALPGFVGDIIK